MALTLSKTGITTGATIQVGHVTQSIDAFTKVAAYDISLSGSLTLTGSLNSFNGFTGSFTGSHFGSKPVRFIYRISFRFCKPNRFILRVILRYCKPDRFIYRVSFRYCKPNRIIYRIIYRVFYRPLSRYCFRSKFY